MIVSILAFVVAAMLFGTNISSLQTMYKACKWDRRGNAEIAALRNAFYSVLANFVVQLLFFVSLGILLFFETIEEANNIPLQPIPKQVSTEPEKPKGRNLDYLKVTSARYLLLFSLV